MPELSLSCGMDCHTDFARSHMNIICLISSEPDRQIGQSEVVDSSSREIVEVEKKSNSCLGEERSRVE